ncbi:MAG: DUF3293 domain-containing protein [Bacteroidota bacterium]
MNRKELETYYRKTSYTAHTEKQIFEIRVDQKNNTFQKWLRENNIQTWTMLTAANPYSVEFSDEENKKRNANFESHLQTENIHYGRSEGIPDDPNWMMEIGFFITNITLNAAKQLAKSVEQNAIVFGRVGESAQLIWLNS